MEKISTVAGMSETSMQATDAMPIASATGVPSSMKKPKVRNRTVMVISQFPRKAFC